MDIYRLTISEPSATRPRQTLLTIPTELRLVIYAYLFEDIPHIIEKKRARDLATKERHGWAWERPRRLVHVNTVQLLRVCHQLYDEALPLLYKPVRFNFGTGADLRDFLNEIGSRSQACISSIDIPYEDHWHGHAGRREHQGCLHQAMEILNKHCTRLRRVRIVVYDYDIATAELTDYQHPAEILRGLQEIEIKRWEFSCPEPVVDTSMCSSYLEKLKARMMLPSEDACRDTRPYCEDCVRFGCIMESLQHTGRRLPAKLARLQASHKAHMFQ